ncbi:asparagine synthase (glutamine-hydrolyzing) [Neorhodopirellula lusitana]|uniref:asparagine synthase (glutamine-hydrolyzing) n=1 Tax=Neorhodopirellula lusitana TaxID=445327 RepID=UPI00384E8ABF
MCGFVGGTLREGDYDRGIQSIRHRGPDDQQVWRDERVTLAFARLAIIDLDSRSAQPMHSPDGQVVIVFNGEIYGYRNLRDRLAGLGHKFQTQSDTEVLLHAYLQWGDSFVEHIDGMFAIAIYDKSTDKIGLWRDRVGIKPLYYFWDQKHFIFASEIKAIQELLGKPLQPNLEAYYDFLTYQTIPAPKTGFKNVYQLRPAHRIQFDLTNQRLADPVRYWELIVEPDHGMTIESAQEQLREHLRRSVREQLIADVPVGCFLSGGVDSSVLAYEGSRASSQLKTFSMGFEGESSELPYARKVAEQLGTEHHENELPRTAIDFEKLKQWFDEPFGDTSAFPTHAVAAAARQHVTVALSGDGGDELFGGYGRYLQVSDRVCRSSSFFNWWERKKQRFGHGQLPRKGMNYLALHLAPTLSLYLKLMTGLGSGEKHPYAQEFGIAADYDDLWAWREYWRMELPVRTRMQYLDFHRYLPDDLLAKVDRTSMAVSLEVRVPYLAKDVIEHAFRIPETIRYQGGKKGVLRSSYEQTLPADILRRPKKGFGIPTSFQSVAAFYRPAQILLEQRGVAYPRDFMPAFLSKARKSA